MLTHVDHIGIAVFSLSEAEPRWTSLLGVGPYKKEEVDSEGVNTLFYLVGSTKIELLESTKSDGPIALFLEKRGEGIHHTAFLVENIRESMERLAGEGFRLLSSEPRSGADNKWVCFLHPKSANGVLVELCQSK